MTEPEEAAESCIVHEIRTAFVLAENLTVELIADPKTTGLYALIWPTWLNEPCFLDLVRDLQDPATVTGWVYTDYARASDRVEITGWSELKDARHRFGLASCCFYLQEGSLELGYQPAGIHGPNPQLVHRAPLPANESLLRRLLNRTISQHLQPQIEPVVQWIRSYLPTESS